MVKVWEVVEVRKVSNSVMIVLVVEEYAVRQTCGYASQSGKSLEEKNLFMMSRICIV